MSHPTSKPKTKWWRLALFIPLTPVLLVVVLLWLMFFLVSTVCLHIVIWAWWCFRGRDILFVYSDSPIGAGRFLLLRRLASLQSARGGLSSISPHTQVSLLAAVQRFQARTPRGTLPDGERVLWVDWSSQTLPVGLTMRCREPGHFPSPSQSNFRSASAKAESRSVKNSYRVPSRY